MTCHFSLREVLISKGLVTNYGEGGGGYKTGGGVREVLPLLKGRAGQVLAALKGGHKKFWVVFTW